MTFLSVVLAAAACSGCSQPSAQQRADRLCAEALHHPAVNAEPTTVGEIRAIQFGPFPDPPGTGASRFPGADDSAFAAWCWDGGNGVYTSLAAGPNGQVMKNGTLSTDSGTPPPGPLIGQ